ncbi:MULTISPECIES: sensor histidine kinase [Streptomyces]|uniref:sensor histidine kinase n=1 Tax=Streptomyces TaxID=1883 RepID=UPI00163B7E0B|nr:MULTISPECIES: histidine kinase [Streptomyces]MBC2879239.1 two-component sensor histidine kinase [Streptomyces sp. TYQ1024]UBI39790.1 histidine kinase [Streptomyces mobaraensis]UKW32371.1 histidine kinase [Streptomyces sp. TYQ1024]
MTRLRPTTRDRLADLGCFLLAAAFSVATAEDALDGRRLSEAVLFADQLAGGLACAALFLRRRWPVQVAVALVVTGSFSHFAAGPIMVALFTVAARRPPRVTGWVAAFTALPLPVFLLGRPALDEPGTASAFTYFALVAGAFGWGLYVRSRGRLVAGLRERADRAAEEARRQVREEIAREMHDVLAHRLSLLSVHAGALEFRPDAPAEDVRRASGIIRDAAYQALEDLREIIGILRLPAGDAPDRPQPTLDDIPRLVEESREAGMRVEVAMRAAAGAPVGGPPADVTGRTAYRIVQEGLTNARKHAPGADVTVTVEGGPGTGLVVEVRNAVPAPVPAAALPEGVLPGGVRRGGGTLRAGLPGGGASHGGDPGDGASRGGVPGGGVPGAGQGLTGLAERARLADGRLEHGSTDGEFRLRAWLPWDGRRTPSSPPREAVGGRGGGGGAGARVP